MTQDSKDERSNWLQTIEKGKQLQEAYKKQIKDQKTNNGNGSGMVVEEAARNVKEEVEHACQELDFKDSYIYENNIDKKSKQFVDLLDAWIDEKISSTAKKPAAGTVGVVSGTSSIDFCSTLGAIFKNSDKFSK